MNRRDVAPHGELRSPGPHSPNDPLTGYESAQRRRYLRALAEEDCNDSEA